MVETQQLVWIPGLNHWQPQIISTLNTSSVLNQSLYVSKTGSDDTGNGSYDNPFLTINQALEFITNPNTYIRYAIYVAPGEYVEPFQIKPWTAIIGTYAGSNGVGSNGSTLVEITAPTNSCGFSLDWAHSGFSVGFMSGLGFQNHQTWDQDGYGLQPGIEPQLNFYNCTFNSGASFLGPGTSGIDNVMLDGCLSYAGLTVQGWQFLWTRNCTFLGGTINVNAGGLGALENTTWLSQNSSVGSNLLPTYISILDGYSSFLAKADLSNSDVVGNLIINGSKTLYNATIGGIPCSVTLLNGAPPPVLLSCATDLGYNPAVDGYWSPLPLSVSDALDQLAAKSNDSGNSPDYASFFALMPGDNSATVAVGTAVQFPQNGPTSGSFARVNASSFNLPTIGTYEVSFQVSISEPGQLQLAINGIGLANTVVGRATGTNQLCCNTFITTTIVNSDISVINPVGNSTALTITPIAGGTHSVSATLTIKFLS